MDASGFSDVFIKLPLTTVFGKIAGDAADPLILCVHGMSPRNGWARWQGIMPPLAGAGYCVVSVDMPGWGQSPALDRLPLMGERAVSVVLGILDGLQKATAVLIGKSWGGGVVLETALAAPERVNHVVVSAPAFRPDQRHRLAQLQPPAMVVWAKDDPVLPYERAANLMAVLPQAKLVTYDDGGHSPAEAHPNDFAARVLTFLQLV